MLRRKVRPNLFDKYCESLRLMGFASYDEYLHSDAWASFNEWYRSSVLPQWCLVCKSHQFSLHHHDYSRVGWEDLWDVVPLCDDHHKALHQWLAERNEGVGDILGHLIRCFGFSPRFARKIMRPFDRLKEKSGRIDQQRMEKPNRRKKPGCMYYLPVVQPNKQPNEQPKDSARKKIKSHRTKIKEVQKEPTRLCCGCKEKRKVSWFGGDGNYCSACVHRTARAAVAGMFT